MSAFPKHVADRLADYKSQIEKVMQARQAYLQGVLDAFGIEGDVSVDLDAGTYTVPEPTTPAAPVLTLVAPLQDEPAPVDPAGN